MTLPFVGREREIARIETALAAGRNVILRGKFGIGRTSLALEVTRRNAHRWRGALVDFGAPGGAICSTILAQLTNRSREAVSRGRTAKQLAREVRSYEPDTPFERTVIVLDDVAKVTRPKLDLLRGFCGSEKIAQVTVVERFVSSDDVMRLRVALDPAVVVRLGPLGYDDCVEYLNAAAERLSIPWTAADVDLLARTLHGYPLGMSEAVRMAEHQCPS